MKTVEYGVLVRSRSVLVMYPELSEALNHLKRSLPKMVLTSKTFTELRERVSEVINAVAPLECVFVDQEYNPVDDAHVDLDCPMLMIGMQAEPPLH